MQKMADSQAFKTPATIDDPAVLGEIEDALKGLGYAQGAGPGRPRDPCSLRTREPS
jgi:propionyl-CoA synthetase